MKIAVIIGGRGKVGGYLAPMLVREGYRVVSVGRGKTEPFVKDAARDQIEQVTLDRDQTGFEEEIRKLNADVVVDMICFKNEDMLRFIDMLRGSIEHYLVCGSVWMHGAGGTVPYAETEYREPLEEYGIQKHLMDLSIIAEYQKNGFPGTAVFYKLALAHNF